MPFSQDPRRFRLGATVLCALIFGPEATLAADPPPPADVDSTKAEREIAVEVEAPRQDHWAQWRGPLGTGVSPTADPPIRWSETENVRFKVELPGLGHSTPVVWGDTIFVTTAIADEEKVEPRRSGVLGAHDNLAVESWFRFAVLAIDRRTGKVRWTSTVHRALPHEGGHVSASLASASPVVDEHRIYAFFGSFGLFALDHDGKIEWSRQLGALRSKHAHGEGASPTLFGDTLVVNWDHEGQSFLAAFDAKTGQEKWRTLRDEPTSWSSPVIAEVGGPGGTAPQVIVSGTERVRGYDLGSGREIWQCGGLSANVVATPIVDNSVAYVASSYDIRAMIAISLGSARGDLTGSEHVLWSRSERTPYVPSPLLYDGSLYFLRHYQGVLTRVVALTGEESSGPFRLPGVRNIYASPVGAAGRLYITDRQGVTAVLSHGEKPGVLSVNRLDDRFSASPVPVEDTLLLRGEKSLYVLAED